MTAIDFKTQRLRIAPFEHHPNQQILAQILTILSPPVVERLPPYFHELTTLHDVQKWLDKLHSESQLLGIYQQSQNAQTLIGFVFVSQTQLNEANLGYLLAQQQWGQGYGKECIQGLLKFYDSQGALTHLHAGVDADNLPSSKLLQSLGFTAVNTNEATLWYRYDF